MTCSSDLASVIQEQIRCGITSQAVLDIFLSHDLYFPTMVGWVNRHNDARSAIAVKNEISSSKVGAEGK